MKKKLVVLTGAGISAAGSKLSDSDGLWEGIMFKM
jgi:NAD-dependent SIR2 family protein deacetylase